METAEFLFRLALWIMSIPLLIGLGWLSYWCFGIIYNFKDKEDL